MSQRDLARAVGTTRHQIIRYENGAERPEIGRLAALARACSVTVADLVDEEALPPGLAGLRIGAGLTMAAAATALAEHIDPATGIATNRASLSGAEKGTLPLSWRPAPAGSRVRGAMAAIYEVDIDAVRAAWQATFPSSLCRSPAPRKESESRAGSINAPSNEAVTQTAPPSLAETAVQERKEPPARDGGVRLELLTPKETNAFELDAARMYRVHQAGRLIGFVWRDSVEGLWNCATAAEGSLGLIAPLSPRYRRTRQSVLEHLLDHWRTPDDRSAWIGPPPAPEVQKQADTDQLPGAAVLVSGNLNAELPYLHIQVDGETIGHMRDLTGGPGWVCYARLTEQQRRTMTRAQVGARPPTATTTVTDIADAVREFLPRLLEGPVRIETLHGHNTALVGLHPQHMERWELHHGRVSGREDVYARGSCWGWLQPVTGGGRTAHTTAGSVPGGPWVTREEAVAALWAHLTAPLPPPRLGEQARTKRRIRPPRDARPLCPYSDAELARVRLIRDRPEVEHSPYRAESPADHRVLGYVWRKDARRWSYAPATGRPPKYSPALPTAPTRAKALEQLLAQPGPLWADPDSAILH